MTEQSIIDKLHSETATIAWRELQRFYAQGVVLQVAQQLDLVATAVLMAEDNKAEIQELVNAGQLVAPSNDQARQWYADDVALWTVVVAPYVLVQQGA